MHIQNIRQNEDIRQVKNFLTNISNKHNERYYYTDGHVRYSVIQIDSLLALDVIDRLIQKIETLEAIAPAPVIKSEVRKTRRPLFIRSKTLANGNVITNVAWWAKPFLMLFGR